VNVTRKNDRPARTTDWRSTDREEVAAAIATAFPGASGLALESTRKGFYYGHTIVPVDQITLVRYDNSACRFKGFYRDTLQFALPIRGGAILRGGAKEVESRPLRLATAVPSFQQFGIDVAPHTLTITVDVPLDLLINRTRSMVGRTRKPPDCITTVSLASALGVALQRNIQAAFEELIRLRDAQLSPLATASLEDLLLSLMIAALFPDKFSRSLAASEATIRATERARDFIHAFAGQPIKLSELAEGLEVSLRSLQLGFRKNYDCTPLQYLLTRRLDLARERLTLPEASDTVTSIALEAGFLNLGAFSRRYRARFGEYPSATLALSRRLRQT
jgi:AraC-like DNA-binding protein